MPKASIKKLFLVKKRSYQMILDIEKYPEFVPWCLEGQKYKKKLCLI